MSTSKLLKNATAITFDDASQSIKVLSGAAILIVDDRIHSVTEDPSTIDVPDDVEVTDCTDKIITPGFINTHCHMWQTAYRSMGPDVTLSHYFDWCSQTSALSRELTPEDIHVSTLEGYLEGINAGVTGFVDHAHNSWSRGAIEKGFEGASASGARVWWCFTPAKLPGQCIEVEEQWEVFQEIGRKRQGTVMMGLGYDGMGGTKGEEFERLKKIITDTDVQAITVHHLGGPWPSRHSSPPEMVSQGLADLGVPIIISHAPYLSTSDMSCCRERNIHISITPESEFHYGHGQTTGHLISDKASLGIDTNWTFSGDMLTQARLWLQHVRDRGYQKHLHEIGTLPRNTPFTVDEAFLLATRQGGLALHRDDVGVLREGAKADLVAWDASGVNMAGWTNAVAAVMLHANVGDVEHVMIDGAWKKKDFKLVLDGVQGGWQGVRAKFEKTARRIQSLAWPRAECTEKLWGFKETGRVEKWSTFRKE